MQDLSELLKNDAPPETATKVVRQGPSLALKLALELLVVFVGVTAAFMFDSYRDQRNETRMLQQAIVGILAELDRYETRTLEHAEEIDARIAAWDQANARGDQAIPPFYRMTGSAYPPTAAWRSAVAAGLSTRIEPGLALDLGYFYEEFVGIADAYVRYNAFTERELFPRAVAGVDTFYGEDGELLPQFQVHRELQGEFANELRRISAMAVELRTRLVAFSETL